MGAQCCSARDQTMDRQVSAAVYSNKDVDKAIKMVFEHSSSFMRLNLRFAWKNLASMDYFSDTDSFIVRLENFWYLNLNVIMYKNYFGYYIKFYESWAKLVL